MKLKNGALFSLFSLIQLLILIVGITSFNLGIALPFLGFSIINNLDLQSHDIIKNKLSLSFTDNMLSLRTQNKPNNQNIDEVYTKFTKSIIPISILSEFESVQLQSNWESNIANINFEDDKVVRVVNPNNIKLEHAGIVSFTAVSTPSGYDDDGFRFSECMTKSPVSKVKQLLPPETKVGIVKIGGGSKQRVLMINKSTGTIINSELVKEGYARPISRGKEEIEQLLPGFSQGVQELHRQAKDKGIGMYKKCDAQDFLFATDDQFEELDAVVEFQYGDDGGKQIIRKKESTPKIPDNPGDVRKVSESVFQIINYDALTKFCGLLF